MRTANTTAAVVSFVFPHDGDIVSGKHCVTSSGVHGDTAQLPAGNTLVYQSEMFCLQNVSFKKTTTTTN